MLWIRRSMPQDRLAQRARRWVVRVDRGDLSAGERRGLRRFLADDHRARAFADARALWAGLDGLAEPTPAASAVRRWGAKRAAAPVWAGGALAAGLATIFVLAPMTLGTRVDARTAVGESRTLLLEDGSRVLLDSGSSIGVRYTPTERSVRLLSGQARFTATPDPKRPFVVRVGGGSVVAEGTVFVARRRDLTDGGGAEIADVEHAVTVYSGGRALELGPGQMCMWSGGQTLTAALPILDPNLVGWDDGMLEFSRKPLVAVADELNRYSKDRIFVLGRARQMTIDGVFHADDPVAGLKALASSGQVRLVHLPGIVLVSGA